jgi:hypothetical protein
LSDAGIRNQEALGRFVPCCWLFRTDPRGRLRELRVSANLLQLEPTRSIASLSLALHLPRCLVLEQHRSVDNPTIPELRCARIDVVLEIVRRAQWRRFVLVAQLLFSQKPKLVIPTSRAMAFFPKLLRTFSDFVFGWLCHLSFLLEGTELLVDKKLLKINHLTAHPFPL